MAKASLELTNGLSSECEEGARVFQHSEIPPAYQWLKPRTAETLNVAESDSSVPSLVQLESDQ